MITKERLKKLATKKVGWGKIALWFVYLIIFLFLSSFFMGMAYEEVTSDLIVILVLYFYMLGMVLAGYLLVRSWRRRDYVKSMKMAKYLALVPIVLLVFLIVYPESGFVGAGELFPGSMRTEDFFFGEIVNRIAFFILFGIPVSLFGTIGFFISKFLKKRQVEKVSQ